MPSVPYVSSLMSFHLALICARGIIGDPAEIFPTGKLPVSARARVRAISTANGIAHTSVDLWSGLGANIEP